MEHGEKTEIVLEFLRSGIRSGKWDDIFLPKEVDIAEQLSVSRWTVRNAFKQLTAEGLIERRKRLGTRIKTENNSQKLIGAVLRSSGHFYEDVFKYLQKKAVSADYCLQTVDVYGFDLPRMRKHITRSISSLAYLNDDKLILDGYIFRSYPHIDELLKKSPVFFDYFDFIRPDGVTGVLIDYYEMGRIGAEYLLKCGCKHPLLLNVHGPKIKSRHIPEFYVNHRGKKIFDGYYTVLKENGYDPMLYIYENQNIKDMARDLYEIFSDRRSRPDGIFCGNDSTIVKVLKTAAECGYKPKYCIGGFDTPWSRGLDGFYFPSITVPAEDCANALFEQVISPKESRRDIYIKPYLKEEYL